MIIDSARYEDGTIAVAPIDIADAGRHAAAGDGFVWVALSDPSADELDALRVAFELRAMTPDTSPQRTRRPRLEQHGGTTMLSVKTARLDARGSSIEIGDVDVLIGGHHALAIGHACPEVLAGASERLRTGSEVTVLGPMAAVWAVLDAAIEASGSVVDGLGDELERIQIEVFQHSRDQSEEIYLQLRESARLARAMHPMLAIFDRLDRGELVGAPPRLVPLLGDLSDQARRLSEEVVMLSEALDGLLNANLAGVTVRQNVIIQQVSAWAAIAAVATIITGIYGMNFRHMPELGWVLGYPMAIAIIVVTVVALRWYFKRVGWL
jgi:magnesium transporter